jgi:hypothetical protein
MRCGGCATQPARHPCLCHSAAHSPAPFHIRPVPRTPAPCSLHHVTYTYNPQPSSAAHAAWSADAAVTQPILRVRVIAVCCTHRVQLKTAIHAMYGYVDGIKIDVADCKECVCAAAPRCASQCTAIGLSRCCGCATSARSGSAHTDARAADGCVGDPARPRHRPGAAVEGGELAQLMH